MIEKKIKTNDKWLIRGILAIFEKQLEVEKRTEDSKFTNGVGFNKPDAPFLTGVAKFYNTRGYLTWKQKYKARIKMEKYAGQLTNIANEEL